MTASQNITEHSHDLQSMVSCMLLLNDDRLNIIVTELCPRIPCIIDSLTMNVTRTGVGSDFHCSDLVYVGIPNFRFSDTKTKKQTKHTILSRVDAKDSEFHLFFGRIEDSAIVFEIY